MSVEIKNDGKSKYQSFTASWFLNVIGGMGHRDIELEGYGATESECRGNLIEQAKAARDELNAAIEDMIDGLIRNQ